MARAAAELTNVIFRVTGHMAAICDESAAPTNAAAFHLGATAAAKAASVTGEGMRNGDWRIKCVPGKAFLYGKTSYAVLRAVFEFAERHCGYHVLTVDGHDVYDVNPTLYVPICDLTVRPAIYARNLYHGMFNYHRYPVTKANWDRYSLALGSTPPDTIEGQFRVSMQTKTTCHSAFEYLPPAKWFKDHPEYFSMGADGKRHGVPNAGSQICYTNPDAYRLVLESLERFIAADRKQFPDDPPLVYDFTQLDNADFMCLCPECRKVIEKYDRKPGGHKDGGDAGLQLEFVNRLAKDIRAKYPDVIIRTFAYVSTERAPKPGTITVEPNVRIWWCDVYSQCDHTMPLETPNHYNSLHAEELKEWLALTDNIQVWDYMLYTVDFPEVSPDALKADTEFFVKNGVKLVSMETEYYGQPLYELNYYVNSKLYIDPTLDVDSLIRTFCRAYGKGADDMYAAIQELRREITSKHAKTAMEWHSRALPWLIDPSVVRRFADRVKVAYDKESDPVFRSRIVTVLASSWKHLVKTLKKDPSAAKDFQAAQENFRLYAKEAARTAFMEPSDRATAEAKVDEILELLTLRFNDLPAELKDVPEDELVCVDYHSTWPAQCVDDPISERKRAVAANDYKALPVPCGVYDNQSKESFGAFRITAEMLKPNAYSWVKLGKCHVGKDSLFWFPGSWYRSFMLKDFYILADGLPEDPNWYEVWASAREGDKLFLIDRLILRRVKP